MAETRSTDVLIAGQGAAAYAAALYAARYQMDTLIVGDLFGGETAIGGQIENYPGYVEIDGFDLMTKFREQAQNLEVPEITAALEDVEVRDDCFVCKLSDGTEIHAGSVILAIGRERRKIGLEHEEEWIGKGVSFCSTCDAPMYKNKTVAVVGGGNAAVEGAILNARHAKQVYLIYRGDNFWRPEPVLVRQLDEYDNLHVLYNTNVTELIGDDMKGLEAIRIDNPYEGKDVLELDGLFVEIGADPRVDIPRKLGVELDAESDEIHVNKLMETNIPGFYAAGDITDGSGELKQTVTAAAQGAIAALSAYKHISNKGVRCWHHEAVVDTEKDLEAAATGSEPKR